MATWRCPFCNQNATLTGKNISVESHPFNNNNVDGNSALVTFVEVCPNEDCRQYTVEASLITRTFNTTKNVWENVTPARETWLLRPQSAAKVLPDYIPAAIREDYLEACLIVRLSPKASVTLSRRCLQGMIRDFHKIVKKRLFDEIAALEEEIDPTTWAAIEAVRKIGNIGAHMEKDINEIVDVEAGEAQLLIGLIETLIDEWYVQRHNREVRMVAIIQAAAAKG